MEWGVEYSRFFNFPIPTSYSCSHDLKVLSRFKSRSGGTWLHPSSAVLRLSKPLPDSVLALSVLLGNKSYEEHIVSNLNITSPQTSCDSECSGNRTRVLFFSFASCNRRIQKFALRFSLLMEMERFLDIIKESSKEMIDKEVSAITSDDIYSCENYLDPIQQRFDKVHNESMKFSLLPAPDGNVGKALPNMPPSFTDLLIECSTKKRTGQTQLIKDTHAKTEKCNLDSAENVSLPGLVNALELPVSDVTLNPELMRYMSDASFQNMLTKIESAIAELGDELGL